jgi:hypothetical protein
MWVRCEDPATGHQFTLSAAAAALSPGLKILDGRPAVDATGRPLRPKHRKDKAGRPVPNGRRTAKPDKE